MINASQLEKGRLKVACLKMGVTPFKPCNQCKVPAVPYTNQAMHYSAKESPGREARGTWGRSPQPPEAIGVCGAKAAGGKGI